MHLEEVEHQRARDKLDEARRQAAALAVPDARGVGGELGARDARGLGDGHARGLLLLEVARRVANRQRTLLVGTAVLSGFFLTAGIASLSFAPGWAKWNYEGYESKSSFTEYERLLARMDDLPPGQWDTVPPPGKR